MLAVNYQGAQIRKLPGRESAVNALFKARFAERIRQLPGVLQAPFSVGLGCGDALEGIVKDGDDAALLLNPGERNRLRTNFGIGDGRIARALLKALHRAQELLGEQVVEEEPMVDVAVRSQDKVTRAADLPVQFWGNHSDAL